MVNISEFTIRLKKILDHYELSRAWYALLDYAKQNNIAVNNNQMIKLDYFLV